MLLEDGKVAVKLIVMKLMTTIKRLLFGKNGIVKKTMKVMYNIVMKMALLIFFIV